MKKGASALFRIAVPTAALVLSCLALSCRVGHMNTFSIIGSISTNQASPVASARVRIYRVPPLPVDAPDGPIKKTNPTFVEASSGEDGYFLLRDTWRGARTWEYLLEVDCKGFESYRMRLQQMPSKPLHVVLQEASHG